MSPQANAWDRDRARAEELTNRTNQLKHYGAHFFAGKVGRVTLLGLPSLAHVGVVDKFGGCGTIGLAVVECEPEVWTIKLLLMSCRVMSRGVGMSC